MSSFNGLKNITATDVYNSGRFYLGNTVDAGTAGQALVSSGPNEPARWDIHTGTTQPLTMGSNVYLTSGNPDFDGGIPDTLNSVDTTYTAGNGIQISGSNIIQTKTDNQTIRDSGGGPGNQLEVIKVPNSLTISQNGTTIDTFDGSVAKTIDLEGKYSAGCGIEISGHPIPKIETDTDEVTITKNAGGTEQLSVLKVPNSLTAGANLSYTSGSTFDGSAARTINLDSTLLNIDTLSFTNTINPTAIVGNLYLNNPTALLFCDLSSSSNITSPYFLHDVYDPSVTDLDSLTTSYAFIFSSNLKNTFTAKKTSCCIELLIYNYSITGNKFLYLQLGDNVGNEWSVGSSGGGAGTGTRNTARLSLYTDETDKAQVIQTWYLTGLTIGTSYTINPMARTSGTSNYIYAGGSYPACILRGYYLPTSGV